MFFDSVIDRTSQHLLGVTLPTNRVFLLYLLSALVLATLSYLYFRSIADRDARPAEVERGWLGYIFDRSVFLHRSAIQDYIYFAANALVSYGLISQFLIGAQFFYELSFVGLVGLVGERSTPLFAPTPLNAAAYTLVAVLLFDFAVFITHYLQHKVKVLWEFHKVHHSAEVLTPMTLFRMHPVDLFVTGLTAAALEGLAVACYAWMTGTGPQPVTVLGINVVLFGFYLLGYNLRHSHIWLSYPRWVSYILISPAQHQTHHSIEPRHFDKNFGLIFAFWDWMFGTLYVPRRYEKLHFGIDKHEPNPFHSVGDLFLKPFREAWRILSNGNATPVRALAAVAWLGIGLTTYAVLYGGSAARAGYRPPDLHLENMTWAEVERAIAAGYTRVIVPTGGVEQNGLHVVLGKHNHVVRHTSERIAAELGGTLVAPVLAYVPEGETGDRATGHMRYPGTLSLPEPVFEAVLAAAVESYATHGFDAVYLIGDSGGNQAAQARVAERFRQAGGPAAVHHIGDYYAANGQVEWLMEQGYTVEQIGTHAGIRDTSEVLAVHPDGVRRNPPATPRAALGTGSNGEASAASAELGEKMIELKVEAALRQIRALEAPPLAYAR